MSTRTLLAVLPSRERAEEVIARLEREGVPESEVSLIVPRGDEVGENEGIGAAIGTVVGGAGGASLAMGTVGLLVPGVGPVVLIGALASALAGAAGGAAIGTSLDRAATQEGAPGGRPDEAPPFYRDALRRGRAVIAVAADGDASERHAGLLREMGAERLEIVSGDWWRALHLVEGERPAG